MTQTKYRQARNYENLNKAIFDGVGIYDTPQIDLEPIRFLPENWIGFNYARSCEEPELHGIHFFIDDYQFNRVWTNPDSYIDRLRKFAAVCSPDFSTYMDFPKAVQIYNHYRRHWLGAYWQMHGVKVIPTISWGAPDEFEWCFDGEPVGGYVAVSSVGTQVNNKSKAIFLNGYREMMDRLSPAGVLFYGKIPDGCEGNIIPIQAFQEKWRKTQS